MLSPMKFPPNGGNAASVGPRGFLRNHRRWLVVGLLFLVALVNNLDRQSLSILAPTMEKTLGFGTIEYSYVVSAFLAAHTLGYVFAGRVLDRLGVKLGLAPALAFWSAAGMLHAAVNGWLMLAAFRFLLGLGESFNSPGGVKAIAEWIPPKERGLNMAVFSNGNTMGAIIAPPLTAFLALHFGWRWAFVATGVVGFLLLALWWCQYETPAKDVRLTQTERELVARSLSPAQPDVPALSMRALRCHPVCLGFFLARMLTDSLSYFLSFWLPEYLTHARGFTLATIGLVGWIPYLAADLGGPGGGALSDWLVRRGWRPGRARGALMLFAAFKPRSANGHRLACRGLDRSDVCGANLLDGEPAGVDFRKRFPRKRGDLAFPFGLGRKPGRDSRQSLDRPGGAPDGVCARLQGFGELHLLALGILAVCFWRAGRKVRSLASNP